jgi:hypothetical protein
MRSDKLLVVSVVIALLLAVGMITHCSAAAGASSPSSAQAPKPNPAPPVEPAPINYSGKGQQAVGKFPLECGLAVFNLTHVGTSNFAVTLLDSNGEMIELLANTIGNFTGAKAVGIEKKGDYRGDKASGIYRQRLASFAFYKTCRRSHDFQVKTYRGIEFLCYLVGQEWEI